MYNCDRFTPLHVAIRKKQLQCLKHIFRINQQAENSSLPAPFDISAKCGKKELSVLQMAALAGYVEIVKVILDQCPHFVADLAQEDWFKQLTRRQSNVYKLLLNYYKFYVRNICFNVKRNIASQGKKIHYVQQKTIEDENMADQIECEAQTAHKYLGNASSLQSSYIQEIEEDTRNLAPRNSEITAKQISKKPAQLMSRAPGKGTHVSKKSLGNFDNFLEEYEIDQLNDVHEEFTVQAKNVPYVYYRNQETQKEKVQMEPQGKKMLHQKINLLLSNCQHIFDNVIKTIMNTNLTTDCIMQNITFLKQIQFQCKEYINGGLAQDEYIISLVRQVLDLTNSLVARIYRFYSQPKASPDCLSVLELLQSQFPIKDLSAADDQLLSDLMANPVIGYNTLNDIFEQKSLALSRAR